jgi:glycosyltransferase involved in cell wall biosynthesis
MPPSQGTSPLVWFGVVREPSGYADEARSYLLALDQAGYAPVARETHKSLADAGLSGRHRDVVETALARSLPADGYVAVHHVVPRPDQANRPGVPNVVRTMFETDRLPSSFKARLIDADEVWVPAAFNVDTFARGGLPRDRLRVLPETIDFDLFAPGAEPWPIEAKRGFTFLTNFDFTDRKGWDVLLEAWARAFEPDDDVSLVLKCVSMHGPSADGIRRRIDAHLHGRRTAPIVLEAAIIDQAAMPRLYGAADAYVMASRGEGWGRPYMEAMAMGLPTIGSRWSGNLEFMHDGNSWLVDGELVDIPEDAQFHTPLYRGHRWFAPDPGSLAAAMREVFAGGADVDRRAAGARGELIERFGPEPTAARLLELTSDLRDRWTAAQRTGVKPTVAWRGDYGSGHSLAVVNDGIAGALERGGSTVRRLTPESMTVRHDAVGVAAHWPPSFVPPSLGPYVLYQPWEFGTVPETWVESIRLHVDEVWTPSEYSRQSFISAGVADTVVHVVPNGVDLDRFTPVGPTWTLPERGTVFLFVGGTTGRKGIDILLRAYGGEFTADDDVCLVVKSFGAGTFYRGQTAESMFEAFERIPNRPELVVLDDEVPYDRLPSLYRAADVLVQPYRGEGFCLPALEALACGVPVVVTEGGPTDDFTSDACAWRVPARRVPVDPKAFAEQNLVLAPGAFLLEPAVPDLAAAMRAASDTSTRAARAAEARAHAESFGWGAAAAKAKERLDALAGRPPIRSAKPADVPGRRGFLFYAPTDWERAETWKPALHAYLAAFHADDDVTLVFPASDSERATALVMAEIESAGVPGHAVADIALADPGTLGATSLELAADAAITTDRAAAPRARVICPPFAAALRAAAPRIEEAA